MNQLIHAWSDFIHLWLCQIVFSCGQFEHLNQIYLFLSLVISLSSYCRFGFLRMLFLFNNAPILKPISAYISAHYQTLKQWMKTGPFSSNCNIISSKSLGDTLLTLARVGINLWCSLASSSYCASSLTETYSCLWHDSEKKRLNLWLWILNGIAIYIIIEILSTSDRERPLKFTVPNPVLHAGS